MRFESHAPGRGNPPPSAFECQADGGQVMTDPLVERNLAMKYSTALVALVLGLSFGCRKKEPAPAPVAATENAPAAETAAAPAPAPAPYTPGPSAAPPVPAKPLPAPPKYVTANADNKIQERVQGEVDAALTGQLREFVNRNGRMPSSFYEFTLRGLDTIPRPPEGKRWVIDATDMAVKSVPAK